VKRGTAVVLPNANQFVWLTNLAEVTTRTRAFLDGKTSE